MALENKQTDRSAWILRFIMLDSLGIFFKKKQHFSGLEVLDEKLFTRMRTPQSDAIMSAD